MRTHRELNFCFGVFPTQTKNYSTVWSHMYGTCEHKQSDDLWITLHKAFHISKVLVLSRNKLLRWINTSNKAIFNVYVIANPDLHVWIHDYTWRHVTTNMKYKHLIWYSNRLCVWNASVLVIYRWITVHSLVYRPKVGL